MINHLKDNAQSEKAENETGNDSVESNLNEQDPQEQK